ncbi:hypothetical protein HMPREF0239_00127 [Clostridium sp. ATCC BAA-442]|nr:hypothetical protein HMPREF0239_00127 [Clostridium sp. ATCC BAA-442]
MYNQAKHFGHFYFKSYNLEAFPFQFLFPSGMKTITEHLLVGKQSNMGL